MAKLTLAQAEVAAALYALTNVDDLPQIEPSEVFPNRDNIHNGARRTFHGLVKAGLIEFLPTGRYPRYKVKQELFDALMQWRRSQKNLEKLNQFELSCY